MASYQLELIRRYCDTKGVRLSDLEKDLLCKVLANPEKYNGFTSKLYTKSNSGRDYRDTWTSITKWQYRINIDTTISIDQRYYHCADGFEQDAHWNWGNAWTITDIRRIIQILKEIESEL